MSVAGSDGSTRALAVAWWLTVAAAVGVRGWNVFAAPLLWGYDAPGHLSYVFFLDRYRALPWADQGWSYFHPPLHYAFGWLLAQSGSSAMLLRGLAVAGSAASLAIAGCAAVLVRGVTPERGWLALAAFTAVAFLPVHLYVAPMAGNELACAFFGAVALTSLVANERRERPRLAADLALAVWVALALWTKFTGALFLAGGVAVMGLRPCWARGETATWRRAALRIGVFGAAALALSAPPYARNLAEFGTPFPMSREHALVADVEAGQAPGVRTWRDFVAVSPRLWIDPRPAAPHLVHSVWGSAYVHTWIDTRALWNRLPESQAERLLWARRAMLWLGLLPTLLAGWGAWSALGDVARGRRSATTLALLVWAALALLAFAGFAWRVPRVSALKASYLLGLSLPYGVFLARGIEAFGKRGARIAAGAAVGGVAAAATCVYAIGGVHPARDPHRALGAVHALLGETAAARAFYADRLARAPSSRDWLEGLADVELLAGDASRARTLYARALRRRIEDPEERARLGVAAALAGDLAAARLDLDAAVARGGGASVLANRGALHGAAGELAAAEADLRRALTLDPKLAVAWHNLATVLERSDRVGEAEAAFAEWRRAAASPPRGYPYGIGLGRLHVGRRPLLWLDAHGLTLARAPFRGDPRGSSHDVAP